MADDAANRLHWARKAFGKTNAAQAIRAHRTFKHVAKNPAGHRVGSNDGRTWVDAQTGQQVHP
jgi:hypothetical protein